MVQVEEVVIVGASEAALHVIERLPEKVLKHVVVLSGEDGRPQLEGVEATFLARAKSRAARLGTEGLVMRATTRMVCSAPDSTKLERWIAAKRERKESAPFAHEPLVNAVEGFVACPSQEAVLGFLESRAKRFFKKGLRLVDAKLSSLQVALEDRAGESETARKAQAKRVLEMKLSNGTTLFARHVVLADAGTCVGRINTPAFVGRIDIASKYLASRHESFAGGDLKSWESGISFAETDLILAELASLSGKAICIVGGAEGGETCVHLARKAMEALNAKEVLLVFKEDLGDTRDFEVDVGWLGGKRMKDFLESMNPKQKLRA